MSADGWHFTGDVREFLGRAGDFLRSRPALHTMQLTSAETLRAGKADAFGADHPVCGWLERAGDVQATCVRVPPRRLNLTPVSSVNADSLAAALAASEHVLPGVGADHDTAAAFAAAWERHTGATPTLLSRMCLYRLGTLTPPDPLLGGRGRIAGEPDREQVMLWCRDFAVSVGQAPPADIGAWFDSGFAYKRFLFWDTPDGDPVSMAGITPIIAGQIRVDPVFTPANLRGRGYASAVTAEASRAALAEGATEVVLFTDLANPTSNALYQRIGYVPVTDFAAFGFSYLIAQPGNRRTI